MRWDHIVVGAGSSGAVVAARLAEDPGRRVLVLEAGSVPWPSPAVADVVQAADFFAALAEPGLTWADPPVVLHPASPAQPYLQGRGLGGTASVNGMVVQRPLAADLDRWARDLGCPGWRWSTIGPIVERASRGLATVADRGAVAQAWAEAAGGLVELPDSPAEGCAPALATWRNGRRWSSGQELSAVLGRANVEVRGGALVDRVLLDSGRAEGVRLASGEEIEAGSVVLCAGALRTPLVLLRSGIDRPGVGEHLVDHPAAGFDVLRPEPADASHSVVGVVERWSSRPGRLDLLVSPVEHLRDLGRARVSVALLAARSTGRVRLRSLDPADPPIVEPRWLSDEADLDLLAEGVARVARRLVHPAFRRAGLEPVGDVASLADPAAARAWVPGALGGSYHAGGTCRMGAPGDELAVTDEHGRVPGVEGLYVADASVLPELPRANPHLTCVVVAEQVASGLRATFPGA